MKKEMGMVKDYSEGSKDTHFRGVQSFYGDIVNQQVKQQPKYCEPGNVDEGMKGAHRNTQVGPKI